MSGREAGRAEGSRKASETYARRRARRAADELAVIHPSLWDDETRRIVTTLATLTAPSRVDDVLAAELPVTDEELERAVARFTDDVRVDPDRRCRRRDHLPMGFHLPTACEHLEQRAETVPRPACG